MCKFWPMHCLLADLLTVTCRSCGSTTTEIKGESREDEALSNHIRETSPEEPMFSILTFN
jgi:hypothetical protein